MKMSIVVGTRPEIIKLTSLMREMSGKNLDFDLIHTGQHYEWDLSERHLVELGVPRPTRVLGVNSLGVVPRLARMIELLSDHFEQSGTEMVLVEGDTDSALAAALAGSRMNLLVAHIEAGCRSFDGRMPEERNRLVISRCSSQHFPPTRTTAINLFREGIPPRSVHMLGHPIVALVHQLVGRLDVEGTVGRLGFPSRGYFYATLHREENTTDRQRLEGILTALGGLRLPVVMPLHPRTRNALEALGLSHLLQGLSVMKPVAYAESLCLISSAAGVITDSGGIQQEACLLKTPCLMLRNNTEWPETVAIGANRLVGHDPRTIRTEASRLLRSANGKQHRWGNPFGARSSAQRIASRLARLSTGRVSMPADLSNHIGRGYPRPVLVHISEHPTISERRNARYAQLYFDTDGRAQCTRKGSTHFLVTVPQ